MGWHCAFALSAIIPPRKDRPVKLDLPPMATASDISTALGVITETMAAGELTPDEANSVAAIVELKRRAIETVDHEEGLKMLEAGMPK